MPWPKYTIKFTVFIHSFFKFVWSVNSWLELASDSWLEIEEIANLHNWIINGQEKRACAGW